MRSPRSILLFTSLLLSISLLGSCGEKEASAAKVKDPGSKTIGAHEYQLLRTELKLAGTEKPYFLINFAEKKLQIKLKGAVVWSYPIEMAESDPDAFDEFIELFEGSTYRLVRPLTETHLYAGQSKTPDSILTIISEVTKFKPDLLQREVPQRFQMLWGDDLILEVLTDAKGQPKDKFKNTIMEVRHVLQSPFGQAILSVKMSSESALTLYRIADPGLPTMIYPPVS